MISPGIRAASSSGCLFALVALGLQFNTVSARASDGILRCPFVAAGETAVASSFGTGAKCVIINGGEVRVSDAFIIRNEGNGTYIWRTYVSGAEGHPGVALCTGGGCGEQQFGLFSCDPLLGSCSFVYSYGDNDEVSVRFSIPAKSGHTGHHIFDIPTNSLTVTGGIFGGNE